MTNEKIILNFLYGSTNGHVNNLTIIGTELINYSTVIATRDDNNGQIFLNTKKYSRTTSKIQNKIRQLCDQNDIKIIEI